MIKNLIFDVGGTLTVSRWQDGLDSAIMNALKKYGSINQIKFDKTSKEIDRIVMERTKQNNSYSDWLEFTVDKFSEDLRLHLKQSEKLDIVREIDSYIIDNTYQLDNATEVLDKLQKAYSLYVITNGGQRTRRILKHLGLYGFFKDIFISEELKANKETGELFKYFINATNLNPSECLMVGDKPDVDGKCRLVGISFCLIYRGNNSINGGYDFIIKDLNEIDTIINNI